MRFRAFRILFILFLLIVLAFSLRRFLTLDEAALREKGLKGWPVSVTWDEPFVGHLNVFCRMDGYGDQPVKLFVREGGAWFFLPSFALTADAYIEYDERDFELYLEGKELKSGDRLTGIRTAGDEDASGPGSRRLEIVYKSEAYGRIERQYGFDILCSENLPALFIDTDSSTMESIDSDKNVSESGRMISYGPEGVKDAAGGFGVLRARGQSSFEVAKKNYRMSLASSTPLLGMEPDTDWILCANALDASRIRNALAYDLAKALGVEGTPDYRFADVYFNGEYHGNYIICTTVNAGFLRRQAADEDSFMLQTETWQERLKEECIYMERENGLFLEYVWPRQPDEAFRKKAEAVVDRVEEAVLELSQNGDVSGFDAVADRTSFERICLMDLLTNDIDSGQHSSFCFYDGRRGKLVLGPVWDYDKAFGNQKGINAFPEFEAFAHTWPEMPVVNDVYADGCTGLLGDIEDFAVNMIRGGISELSQTIAASWSMDRIVNGGTISSVVDEGTRIGNMLQVRDYFANSYESVKERLLAADEYCRVYFEDYDGRALCIKKGERVGDDMLKYLKKLYRCDDFDPSLSRITPEDDMLVIPVKGEMEQ